IIAELRSHPLAEFRLVGERIKEQAELALPTLLSHARPNAFQQSLHTALPLLAKELGVAKAEVHVGPATGHTELLRFDRNLDDRLLASLLYESSQLPFTALVERVQAMGTEQREQLLDRL